MYHASEGPVLNVGTLLTCVTCSSIHLYAALSKLSNNNITLTQSILGLLPPNLCVDNANHPLYAYKTHKGVRSQMI